MDLSTVTIPGSLPNNATDSRSPSPLPEDNKCSALAVQCFDDFISEHGMDNLQQCLFGGTYSEDDFEHLMALRFWLYGVVLFAICLAGTIGNLIAFRVLHHKLFRSSSTIWLLKGLLCVDTGILLLDIFYYSLMQGLRLYPLHVSPVPLVAEYMAVTGINIFKNLAALFTLYVTAERYVYIRHSLMATKWCTKRRAYIAVGIITVAAIAYEIPRAITLRVFTSPFGRNCTGGEFTHIHTNYYKFFKDELPISDATISKYDLGGLILFFALPVILLTALTTAIVVNLRRAENQRKKMSSVASVTQHNVSIVLVAIVMTYVILSLPMVIFNFYKNAQWAQRSRYQIEMVDCIIVITLATNSAINSILFGVLGKKFRDIFLQIFCPLSYYMKAKKLQKKHSTASVSFMERTLLKDNTQTSLI